MLLMAVADGVGGGPGGEIAADAAIAALAQRFFGAPRDRSIEDRLADAIREANTAVLRAAESSGKRSAASTLVAAVVRDERAVIANLGDSRAYLVRDGTSRQLTEDHSAEIAHGITRFVGDPRGVQPDVFVEDLRRGDRLVLCSDGLTRHVEPDEIARQVAEAADLDSAADELVGLANARGGEDNVTLILYDTRAVSGAASGPRRALALGIFVALVVLVVAGAIAVLFSAGPLPSASPLPSPSATPEVTATPLPTITPAPTATP
jgi:serine/threonine protein phosphatase PrpC